MLDSAVAHGLIASNPAEQVVLPRRRRGRAWSMQERRFLTRAEIKRLRAEVPDRWQPLFALLAATGLRISEAVGLRWSDLTLDGPVPHLHVHRAFVRGMLVAPSPVMARARFRSQQPWRVSCGRTFRLMRTTTPMSSPAVLAGRRIRAACAGACSSRLPNGLAREASAFTRCAIAAPRC